MSNTDLPGGTPSYPYPQNQPPAGQPWALSPDVASGGAAQNYGPVYTYTFKVKPGRVKGGLSEYQTGTITLAGDALHLQGKAQLPAAQRSAFALGGAIGGAIASSIRIDRADRLPWDCVHQIVLEPEKKRACLVYTMPGKAKPFYSLAFLVGDLYDNFVQAARYYARDKVTEGKIGPATPVWAWIVLAIFIILIICGAIAGGDSPHH